MINMTSDMFYLLNITTSLGLATFFGFILFEVLERLSELRDRAVVYEVKIRPCSITGREVIEWDVTNKLPIKVTKRREKKKSLSRGDIERAWSRCHHGILVNQGVYEAGLLKLLKELGFTEEGEK